MIHETGENKNPVSFEDFSVPGFRLSKVNFNSNVGMDIFFTKNMKQKQSN